MSEDQTEDIKTIRVLTFSSKQQDWDEWSQKFLSMAAERGYREIMEDKERPPRESLNIEETENDGTYKLSESERNELKKKGKCKRVQRFAACLQTSGCRTGQHLKDEDPAKWMS